MGALVLCTLHAHPAMHRQPDPSTLSSALQVYYYRANYLLLCGVCYGAAFLRNPLALAALVLTTVAVLATNDSFATGLNDSLLRIVRRIHAPTAVRLRARAHVAHPDGSLGWVMGLAVVVG